MQAIIGLFDLNGAGFSYALLNHPRKAPEQLYEKIKYLRLIVNANACVKLSSLLKIFLNYSPLGPTRRTSE